MKTFCCLIMFLVMVHTTAAFADLYAVGFQWDWRADWTPRPPSDFGTTNGNPAADQHGNPVYSYEYIRGLGSGNILGSSSPWYTHATGRMVWDNNWYGQTPGIWVYADNTLPNAAGGGTTVTSYGASVRRWINPTGESIFVDYSIASTPSGGDGYIRFGSYYDAMDLAICLDHGSGPAGVDLLYAATYVTPPGYTSAQVVFIDPVNLHGILLQPGESIFLTEFGHSGVEGTVYSGTITRVADAVAPVPAPGAILLGILGLGTAGWRLRKRGTE